MRRLILLMCSLCVLQSWAAETTVLATIDKIENPLTLPRKKFSEWWAAPSILPQASPKKMSRAF